MKTKITIISIILFSILIILFLNKPYHFKKPDQESKTYKDFIEIHLSYPEKYQYENGYMTEFSQKINLENCLLTAEKRFSNGSGFVQEAYLKDLNIHDVNIIDWEENKGLKYYSIKIFTENKNNSIFAMRLKKQGFINTKTTKQKQDYLLIEISNSYYIDEIMDNILGAIQHCK